MTCGSTQHLQDTERRIVNSSQLWVVANLRLAQVVASWKLAQAIRKHCVFSAVGFGFSGGAIPQV